jgi:hypothetical protein
MKIMAAPVFQRQQITKDLLIQHTTEGAKINEFSYT